MELHATFLAEDLPQREIIEHPRRGFRMNAPQPSRHGMRIERVLDRCAVEWRSPRPFQGAEAKAEARRMIHEAFAKGAVGQHESRPRA